MKNWILVWASVAFVTVLIVGTSIGLSKTWSTALTGSNKVLSSSPLFNTNQITVTGMMQTWGEEEGANAANSVLNVAVNWDFSSDFNVIEACNLTTDRVLPNGTIALCQLSGQEQPPVIIGSGEMISDMDRTVSVRVLCDPTGGMNFVGACDVQDIGGVQIIFIRTIVIQVCTEFSRNGESIQGWDVISCYDIPRTTQVEFSGDAVLEFTQIGSLNADYGTVSAPPRANGFATTGLLLSWDEFTGEITNAEWMRKRGNDVETVPILVPLGANDIHLSLSGSSARIDQVEYVYSGLEGVDPVLLDAPSQGNERLNELHFTIQDKNLI
jgi:hypothetical protein